MILFFTMCLDLILWRPRSTKELWIIVQHNQRKILAKYDGILWWYVLFLIHDIISDVILLCFTNFATQSPFRATRLEFYKIFIRSKVVQRDLRNTLTKSFFDTMSHFWLMTSIVTSFCSISLICLLIRLFERLNLIFTKHL